MSIPKIIHWCWMSNDEFPEIIQECINSWKEIVPDYTIKLWNSNNFDVNICRYTREAMDCKKYAFVSDYIRLYALYTEGGIYLDSDVKVIKKLDKLLDEPAFIGYESGGRLGPWLIASQPGNVLIKELLDYYNDKSFYNSNGEMDCTPNTIPVTNILVKHGLRPDNCVQKLKNITILPEDYFCPKNPWNGKVHITENTMAMHLFRGAWNDTASIDLPFIASIENYVADFVNYIKKDSNKVIIYGLGVVGRNVLEQLKLYKEMTVECILVTRKDNGWESVDSIPIVEIKNSMQIKKDIPILISTIPKYHLEIEKTLLDFGYNNIYCLGSGR